MIRHTLRLALLCVLLGLLVSLAGCTPGFPPGPDGTVTDRGATYFKSAGWRRHLTVRSPDGEETRFRVSRADYHHCLRASRYPACAHH